MSALSDIKLLNVVLDQAELRLRATLHFSISLNWLYLLTVKKTEQIFSSKCRACGVVIACMSAHDGWDKGTPQYKLSIHLTLSTLRVSKTWKFLQIRRVTYQNTTEILLIFKFAHAEIWLRLLREEAK